MNPRPSPWQGDALPLSYSRNGRLLSIARGSLDGQRGVVSDGRVSPRGVAVKNEGRLERSLEIDPRREAAACMRIFRSPWSADGGLRVRAAHRDWRKDRLGGVLRIPRKYWNAIRTSPSTWPVAALLSIFRCEEAFSAAFSPFSLIHRMEETAAAWSIGAAFSESIDPTAYHND